MGVVAALGPAVLDFDPLYSTSKIDAVTALIARHCAITLLLLHSVDLLREAHRSDRRGQTTVALEKHR